MLICKAERCTKAAEAKGLCGTHYMRTRRRPDGSYEDRRRCLYGGTPLERYEHAIDRSGSSEGCHPWLGGTSHGYGKFWAGEYKPNGLARSVRAHTWGFRQLVGPLRPGQVVRHLCHNKLCQNPQHWAAGTHRDNVDDDVRAGRHRRLKLTAKSARAIKDEYAAGGVTYRALAERYGITETHVSSVIRGDRWRAA